MKVKINIEVWDNTSAEKLESLGVTDRFATMMYELAFKEILKKACQNGAEYSIHVETEDNTKE